MGPVKHELSVGTAISYAAACSLKEEPVCCVQVDAVSSGKIEVEFSGIELNFDFSETDASQLKNTQY